jgi:hypothetical protein
VRFTTNFLAKTALSNAGLADQEEDAPLPRGRCVESRAQSVELGLASDEDAGRGVVTCGSLGPGELERRILSEDRLLKGLKSFARLDPQLVHHRGTCGPICVESLGLPSRAVEGDHELRAQALTQWMETHESFELPHNIDVQSTVDVAVNAPLDAGEVELLEAGNLWLRETVRRELGERLPPPVRERLPGLLRGQTLKTIKVKLVLCHPQPVPGRLRLQPVLSEDLS